MECTAPFIHIELSHCKLSGLDLLISLALFVTVRPHLLIESLKGHGVGMEYGVRFFDTQGTEQQFVLGRCSVFQKAVYSVWKSKLERLIVSKKVRILMVI